MKHLTIDEIIDFVSIERMDAESLELASKITTHMRDCDECLNKVRAFQNVFQGIKAQQRVAEASKNSEDAFDRIVERLERKQKEAERKEIESKIEKGR